MASEREARRLQLERFVALDPGNLALRAELADCLIEQGAAAEALPHIEHALRLAPGDSPFRYRRAVVLRRSGHSEEAVSVLDALLDDGLSDAAVLYERADLAFQLGDYEGCVRSIDRLLHLSDAGRALPGADLLKVRALHYLGRVDEAIAHAEAALRANSSRTDLRAPLATLYLDAERYADAARLYHLAASDGAVVPELECVGGYLALAEEKLTLAQQRFRRVLQERPQDGRGLLGSGLAAAADGQLPQAVEQLQRAVEAMPNHLGTLNALAWMQILSGQLDAADATLTRAQSVDDTFAETWGGQATVAALRGEREAAQALIRTAQRLDRNCFSAAYAAMLLQHGPSSVQTTGAVLTFLGRQSAPGGGTLRDAIVRMARRGRT